MRQLFPAVDRCRDRSGRSPDRLSRVHRPSIAGKGCLNEQPPKPNRGVEKRKTCMVTLPNTRWRKGLRDLQSVSFSQKKRVTKWRKYGKRQIY